MTATNDLCSKRLIFSADDLRPTVAFRSADAERTSIPGQQWICSRPVLQSQGLPPPLAVPARFHSGMPAWPDPACKQWMAAVRRIPGCCCFSWLRVPEPRSPGQWEDGAAAERGWQVARTTVWIPVSWFDPPALRPGRFRQLPRDVQAPSTRPQRGEPQPRELG